MPNNDLIILDRILEQRRDTIASDLDTDAFFELFSSEQILKDLDLTYEELKDGIVSGPDDGGIDASFLFANGELVREDTDLTTLKSNIALNLVVIQAKNQASFSEVAVDKLTTVSRDFLDLGVDTNTLVGRYNSELVTAIQLFKSTYEALAARFPQLRIDYYYASKGGDAHPKVHRKAEGLKSTAKQMFPTSEVEVHLLGAPELLALARQLPKTTYQLRLSENPISTTGTVGYIGLVQLRDFYSFMSEDDGRLILGLFEANVRDYQGANQVNEDIRATLEQPGSDEFWWLNNGVTILASQVTLAGRTLTLENPRIVNGLQTSKEIHKHFQVGSTSEDRRSLLARVIVPTSPDSRDKIIKATNTQTPISAYSLRATEKIHRDIEEYLIPFGMFYDRRKNYYKNQDKPVTSIVSISRMAQAVMAIVLQQPDMARARPSSLLKDEEAYGKVFSAQYPLEVYRVCPAVLKLAENALRRVREMAAKDRNNLRFYVATAIASKVLRKVLPTPTQIGSVQASEIDEVLVDEVRDMVTAIYNELGGTDQVAKGTDFINRLKGKLQQEFGRTMASRTSKRKH